MDGRRTERCGWERAGTSVETRNSWKMSDDDEDNDCPICMETMEPLTFRGTERNRIVCCGKFICPTCAVKMNDHQLDAMEKSRLDPSPQTLKYMEQSLACPLCRTEVPSTAEGSFQLTLENANKGRAWAQYNLGYKYESGRGAPGGVNMKKARFWFEKAARQGNSWAMDAFGARLETDLKDIIGAKEWYEKSVRADHYPKALVHLGHLLHDGKAGIPKDSKEAFRLFQLAADQGYDVGLEWVGLCYEMGPDGGGVPTRDMEKSLYFRLKAAEQGNTTAMHNVGTTLLTIASEKYNSIEIAGKSPIPQVLFWFRKAAALGDKDSQNMVTQIERNLSSQCATCKSETSKGGKKLNRCVRCKAVYYCGADCQKRHWAAGHKIDCFSGPK